MTSDPFEPLLETITAKVELTGEQILTVRSAFVLKKLKKKEMLLRPGQTSNHLYFVSSGCLRVYTWENEKEIITQFGIRGWCINDLTSYLTRTPARQYIQAIENSVLLQIHRDSLQRLMDQVPPMERFLRIKFENAHQALQERHLHALSQSAKERYEEFRIRYREIEQRVPQYMIASYLGITKEFLSYLRNAR